MKKIKVTAKKNLKGTLTVPADKSISHRAMLFGALAHGKTRIENFLEAGDCLSTVDCLESLGVSIRRVKKGLWVVDGKGKESFKPPEKMLYAGNSGTTARLMSGILSCCPFISILNGDASLRQRPMKRVTAPLRKMGARIYGKDGASLLPLVFHGREPLNSVSYKMNVASAQVKSAILLAGLFADGETRVHEPLKSRDHTERMLKGFGVSVKTREGFACVKGGQKLTATDIVVPGDISSAAFFIAAALLCKQSKIVIKNVTLNPTRTGFLSALKRMGASVTTANLRTVCNEPVGDILAETSTLHACALTKEIIPSLIDEIPVLCVLATQARGTTVIRGAKELRVKETDRIKSMTKELRKMGARINELKDGMSIEGPAPLSGVNVDSHGDHRTAMSLCVAALAAEGETIVRDTQCISISFPEFEKMLNAL